MQAIPSVNSNPCGFSSLVVSHSSMGFDQGWEVQVMKHLAQMGSVPLVVEWLERSSNASEIGRHNPIFCTESVKYDKKDLLKYFYEDCGFALDIFAAMEEASANGCLECLIYMDKINGGGLPAYKKAWIRAAQSNQYEVLLFLYNRSIITMHWMLDTLLTHGFYNIVKWLHQSNINSPRYIEGETPRRRVLPLPRILE